MEVAIVQTDGRENVFSQRDFFSEYPDALHGSMAMNLFSPMSDAATTTKPMGAKSSLRAFLLPSLYYDRASKTNVDSLHAWVGQRARALVPGATIERVDFRWFFDTFDYQHADKPIMSRQSSGIFSVRLNEPSK
jgi:hypothetical protein